MSSADFREKEPQTEYDPEYLRVIEFTNYLSRLDGCFPETIELDFSEDRPVEYAKNRFLTYEHNGGRNFFVEPGYFEDVSSGIEFVPLISRSGKSSAHGVFFGDFKFGNGRHLTVAVKPHETESATKTCLEDFLNGRAVERLGMYTVHPMGFIVGAQQAERAYSFTVLEDSLTTLDSVDWSGFIDDIDSNTGMQEIWRQVSQQAAVMHSGGNISHGDLAPRNIAVDAENAVFFIDWERANISKMAPRDAEVRFHHSYMDISVLLESMCRPPGDPFKPGIGIFFDHPEDWWERFEHIFFERYKEGRQILASQAANNNKTEKRQVEEELMELERTLRTDMDMMRNICDTMKATLGRPNPSKGSQF